MIKASDRIIAQVQLFHFLKRSVDEMQIFPSDIVVWEADLLALWEGRKVFYWPQVTVGEVNGLGIGEALEEKLVVGGQLAV